MDESGLEAFIDSHCEDSRLRVEADLGDGFFRLRSSEADRRQAAQDIRCAEDIVIELLRNARDARSRNIYIATQRNEEGRLLVTVDDGEGIPEALHGLIFEPRVTSKLDTAHKDKWGMHGRGMALYSIKENAVEARVAESAPHMGSSMMVRTDPSKLPEKTDQSTFPRFEKQENGNFAMRGPRNLLRTSAEFALEHRNDCNVYLGSPVEVAATLFAKGQATLTPAVKAFGATEEMPVVKRLAMAADPAEFTELASAMGLNLSQRSARRIMDGAVAPLPSLMERLEAESFPKADGKAKSARRRERQKGLRLSEDDLADFEKGIRRAFSALAESYYLDGSADPSIRVDGDALRITIPLVRSE